MSVIQNFALDLEEEEEEVADIALGSEPPAKKARFAESTLQDVANIIESRVPISTKRTTEGWVKVFEEFCKQRKLAVNLKTDSPGVISDALALLYVNARGREGQAYQRSSLLGLRSALHRHIQSFRPTMNIYSDAEFVMANQALDGRMRQMKRSGESKPAEHKAVITDTDMAKLGRYFSQYTTSAVVLTESVWFAITYHFALRGCENQETMTKKDLILKKDDDGRDFVELATDFCTKNHQGGIASRDKPSDGRIQQPEQVHAVKLLLESLSPKSERLFQMASRSVKPGTQAFNGLPLGKNTIKAMMKRISNKANLSRSYTNHCVRATAVQKLVDAGVSETAIMGTTGHRQVLGPVVDRICQQEFRTKEKRDGCSSGWRVSNCNQCCYPCSYSANNERSAITAAD
eukprot:scpid32472/ scgid33697/ 